MHQHGLAVQAIEDGIDIRDHEFQNGGAVGARFGAPFGKGRHRLHAADAERRGGRDDLGELRREPVGGLTGHSFVEGDHRFDIGGDQADRGELHGGIPEWSLVYACLLPQRCCHRCVSRSQQQLRRAERLFQIIQLLRRSTRPITAAAVAAELEVSTRTVYRDIADLLAQRVPITGTAGFGYLLAAEYDMPPLMLTQVELEAIVLGAQWVAARGDPLLSPAASDVLAKVATAVPEHLRPFIAAPTTGVPPRIDPIEDAVDAATLRDAIRARSKLRLLYRADDGERTERTVWPILLGYSETHRILIAWCEWRQEFRHFRTDRMMTAAALDQAIPEPKRHLHRRWEAWRAAELRGLPQRHPTPRSAG
nr:YafY family protein [Sphingomonas sp. PAMC 26617]